MTGSTAHAGYRAVAFVPSAAAIRDRLGPSSTCCSEAMNPASRRLFTDAVAGFATSDALVAAVLAAAGFGDGRVIPFDATDGCMGVAATGFAAACCFFLSSCPPARLFSRV